MNTPICDFVRQYARDDKLRLHMPGHKGQGNFCEALDITEVFGADSLYEAEGIIRQSELNASAIFGADTFYSAEGSSLSIRAMLFLAVKYAKVTGKEPYILAGRNAHKTFITTAALLGLDFDWIISCEKGSYLSCDISAEHLDAVLCEAKKKPIAVYITSPDYLGNIADIKALSDVCKRHGVLLLVDNAHGAYLKFLPRSLHPIDLGADICCDSAHKTLPVLTGGAYIHIAKAMPDFFRENVKEAMSIFGSTSPSYLILQSLDNANKTLSEGFAEEMAEFLPQAESLKAKLIAKGYCLVGDEPLKITLDAAGYGYTGQEIAERLRADNIECEFCDKDYVVLMISPRNGLEGLDKISGILLSLPQKTALERNAEAFEQPKRAMPINEALMCDTEVIPVEESVGRIYADISFGCPPAVPLAVCGEVINRHIYDKFLHYGIKTCKVIKK